MQSLCSGIGSREILAPSGDKADLEKEVQDSVLRVMRHARGPYLARRLRPELYDPLHAPAHSSDLNRADTVTFASRDQTRVKMEFEQDLLNIVLKLLGSLFISTR